MSMLAVQHPLAERLAAAARMVSLVLAGAAGLVLAFRLLGDVAPTVMPSLAASFSILCCATALALPRNPGVQAAAVALLAAAGLVALGTIIWYLAAGLPGPRLYDLVLAPSTSGVVLILAVAVYGIRRDGPWPLLGQGAAALVVAVCVLTLNSRIQGTTSLGALGARFPMTLVAALMILVTGLSVLCVRPDRGITAALIDRGPAGAAARRLIVPITLLPLLLNLMFGYGEVAGWYSIQTEEALFTLTTVILVLALLGWQISTLLRSEETRRLLEASTARAEVEMRRLVESVTDYAIYSLDADGRITTWNRGAERMKGFTAEEVIGVVDDLCFPPEVRATGILERLLKEAREEGRAVYEGTLLRKGGSELFAQAIYIPLRNAEDELIGYARVTRDMTLQKQAEDERVRLTTLLNTAEDPIIVIDADGTIERFNPAAERVFGYAAEEILGRSIGLLLPEPEHSLKPDGFRRPGAAGPGGSARPDSDGQGRRADGSLFPVELSISEMTIHGRRKYTGLVRDITERKQSEAALRDSEERMGLAVEAGQLGVWDMDVESDSVRASGPLARMLISMRPAVSGITTMTEWFDQFHPADREKAEEELNSLIEGRVGSVELEHRMRDGNGDGWRWLFSRARAQDRDENGRAVRIIGVTLDINKRKNIEETLRKNQIDLDMALKGASFHLWHYYVKERRLVDLDRLLETLGYECNEETKQLAFWRSIIHSEDLAVLDSLDFAPLPEQLKEKNGLELRLRAKDGSWRWLVTRARIIESDRDGRPLVVAGTCLDITERKKAEDKLLHAAQHDPLTGLPNRALTYAFGEHILDTATRHGGVCAVLFVDLDRFKPINDTYGHAAGDAVLVEVAERLRHCVRTDDVVGRLGGDEFLVVLAPLPGPDEISRIAHDCLVEVRKPYRHRAMEFVVSPSIGISLYPNDGRDMQTLVKHADTAMYHAKEGGRNTFRFFTPAMNARASTLLKMENEMRRAIEREEFEVYYQPVVDTDAGRVVAVEALLRWPSSGFGPDDFIPVAESSGLIIPLGKWMLRQACRQQKEWADSGLAQLRVSVNISPVQFRQQQFMSMVSEVVLECGLDPRDLQLEITESAILRNVEEVITMLRLLRQHGHRVALDDFGKGYSSLNYLRTLPLDAVKVDKDFVHELSSDPVNLAITEAIIQLGLSLGLQVIAEGIESGEVMDLLRSKQCRHMQGFYIGEPLAAEDFEAWFRVYGSAPRAAAGAHWNTTH